MRFFRTFLVAVLAVTALYLGSIVAVNPRGDFAGTRFPWLYANTRKLKLNLYQKYGREKPVEIVVFGSSRTMVLDPRELETLSGMRAFNFGVFSALPEDFLAIYRWLRRTNGVPRILLVGVDLGALGAGAEPSAELLNNRALAAELDPSLREPIHAAVQDFKLYKSTVTTAYARDAIRAVQLAIRPREPFNTFRADGAMEYPGWDREIAAGTFDKAKVWESCAAGAINLTKVNLRDSVSSTRLGHIGTLIREARGDDVRIVVWVTPSDPGLSARLSAEPLAWRRSEEARNRLDSVATSNHAKLLDLTDPASFGGDPKSWYDCQHYHHADAARIARLLLQAAQVDVRGGPLTR
jgi:hypothetical protein